MSPLIVLQSADTMEIRWQQRGHFHRLVLKVKCVIFGSF